MPWFTTFDSQVADSSNINNFTYYSLHSFLIYSFLHDMAIAAEFKKFAQGDINIAVDPVTQCLEYTKGVRRSSLF